MQIIPAIDVLDGAVVRLLRGDFGEVTRYATDPVHVASRWIERGATLVHVVDLDAARGEPSDRMLWAALARAGIPFQIGGGIRTDAIATDAIAAGARRVVVGTAALGTGDALGQIVAAVGAERVVVAIDVREGRARGAGWRDEGIALARALASVAAAGVERILVTGIERDGAMVGPDLDLLAEVRRLAPDLHLIASGGVGTLADLETLSSLGIEAAIVGRALYEGRIDLPAAISACR